MLTNKRGQLLLTARFQLQILFACLFLRWSSFGTLWYKLTCLKEKVRQNRFCQLCLAVLTQYSTLMHVSNSFMFSVLLCVVDLNLSFFFFSTGRVTVVSSPNFLIDVLCLFLKPWFHFKLSYSTRRLWITERTPLLLVQLQHVRVQEGGHRGLAHQNSRASRRVLITTWQKLKPLAVPPGAVAGVLVPYLGQRHWQLIRTRQEERGALHEEERSVPAQKA